MRNSVLYLFFFLVSFSVFSQKPFEGSIEYDLKFESFNSSLTETILKEIFGAKLKFFIKDGAYMREYLDEKGNTIQKIIFLPETNGVYYMQSSNQDAIFYSYANEKLSSDYKITDGASETILNCTCPSKIIQYRHYQKLLADTVDVKFEYFFCKELYVNPNYYKNFFIWYDIVKEQKSIAIKFTEEMSNFFKTTYTAIKIENIQLKKEMFDIDKKAVLVKE